MGEQRKACERLKRWFAPNEHYDESWPFRAWGWFLYTTRVGSWYRRNISTPISVFIEFLERLWGWIPVLWKDKDWDEFCMLRILQYKIKRMRDLQTNYGHSTSKNRTIRQMRFAEIVIDRIIEDDYFKAAREAHEKKWGAYCRRKKWTDGTSVGNAYNIRQNATTHTKYLQQKVEESTLEHRCRSAWKKDKDRLFKHIRKYMDGWWD